MNKLELLGIGTQPKYDDNDQWTGAEIFANIEAEIEDEDQRGLHRVGIKLEISPTLAQAVRNYGYDERTELFLMNRVEACLNSCQKKYTERDTNTIYEVMRLKMPRFVAKSADRIFYVQNFRTGEIDECTEEQLDRNV
jgi:hypothetical protein